MGKYQKPTAFTQEEFSIHMADIISSAITITGTQFSYNLLTNPVTPEDVLFKKNYSRIILILKDRGYKVWGIPPEGNDIYKFYISS